MSYLDCFLRIDGIEGNSTDYQHFGWIDVEDFQHYISLDRKAMIDDVKNRFEYFSVVKYIDQHSPLLAQSCRFRKIFSEIIFEGVRPSNPHHKVLEYRMANIIIDSISIGNVDGDPLTPGIGPLSAHERLTFLYEKIEFTFYPPDLKTGEPLKPISRTWSIHEKID